MKYTRENILEGINVKLEEWCWDKRIYGGLLKVYKQELPQYPIEVEQNVLEWINGEPITEVDCHGMSIRRVMDCFDLSDDSFPLVLRDFISFKKGGFRNQSACFMSFQRYD
jgi:hypothetical protein